MRKFVVFAMSMSLLCSLGCEKNNPSSKARIAGPTVAPTLHQPLPAGLPDQGTPQVQTAQVETAPETDQVTEKPKKKPHSRKPTVSSPPVAGGGPPSNVAPAVPETANANTTVALAKPPKSPADAAADAAISADVPPSISISQKDKANRDLESAEGDVKSMDGRNLSSDEQSILSQVKAYIVQSRKALADGDYERAMNLANKAKLLTDALKKM